MVVYEKENDANDDQEAVEENVNGSALRFSKKQHE
jgi:hypothetical protein